MHKKYSLGELTARKKSQTLSSIYYTLRTNNQQNNSSRSDKQTKQSKSPYAQRQSPDKQIEAKASFFMGSSLSNRQMTKFGSLGTLDKQTLSSLMKSDSHIAQLLSTTSRYFSRKSSLAPDVSRKPSNVREKLIAYTLKSPSKPLTQRVKPQYQDAFIYLYIIGVGGFGRVWKVQHQRSGQVYALKQMSKALIVAKISANDVMNERAILSDLKHPFIVNMHIAFQDRENLSLVMDYMMGGDLRYHMGLNGKFSEDTTRFFLACIIQGLEYIHQQKVIHRDLKPENLVMDENGYLHITDFGLSRLMRQDNSNETSGTPGYLAPEVISRQQQGEAVDFFALGVIAYELIMGKRPYPGKTRGDYRDSLFNKTVLIKRQNVDEHYSSQLIDLINRLLVKKPGYRLGSGGIHQIKQHPFFQNFPWGKLAQKSIKPSYLPNVYYVIKHMEQLKAEDETNQMLIEQNRMILGDTQIQNLFSGYEYTKTNLKKLSEQRSTGALITLRRQDIRLSTD